MTDNVFEKCIIKAENTEEMQCIVYNMRIFTGVLKNED